MLSMFMSSFLKLMSGANFPSTVAGNVPAIFWFLNVSGPNLSLGWLSGPGYSKHRQFIELVKRSTR